MFKPWLVHGVCHASDPDSRFIEELEAEEAVVRAAWVSPPRPAATWSRSYAGVVAFVFLLLAFVAVYDFLSLRRELKLVVAEPCRTGLALYPGAYVG